MKKLLLTTALCIFLTGCGEVIDTGNSGVKTFFGEITSSKPLDEGLYFYFPFFQNVYEYDCKTQLFSADYSTYTKDIQPADLKVAINYSVNKDNIISLHQTVGVLYEKKILFPISESIVKDVIGTWDATSLVENREKAAQQIYESLNKKLNESGFIKVENVSIKNIDYSNNFEKSIEAKVVARQKAEEAKNRTVEVEEKAKQQVIEAEAEAKSMKIRSQALAENKNLIQYEAVQKWNGVLPVNLYGSAPLPFLDVKK